MRSISSWPLATKLAALVATLLALALASIGLTLWITWQLDGGAAAINEAGVAAWVLGSVTSAGADGTVAGFGSVADLSADSSGVRLISGTKGVQAGAVLLHGEYRLG